jgi:hypothetical protein
MPSRAPRWSASERSAQEAFSSNDADWALDTTEGFLGAISVPRADEVRKLEIQATVPEGVPDHGSASSPRTAAP